MKSRILFCGMVGMSVFGAQAEPIETEVEQQETTKQSAKVVVTANRRATQARDIPVMVTHISNEELQTSSATTVDEYLVRTPDASAKRSHIAECGPGREITLRGIPEQRRTLVLVDGIPMNDGFSGAVNWSIVPKGSIDHVEMIHGPMSALYGSGAMGGVINIISAKPKGPRSTKVGATYGNYNTSSVYLEQSAMGEKHGYYVSGQLYDTDGYKKVKKELSYHKDNERTDYNLMGKYFYMPDEYSTITTTGYLVDEDYNRGRIYNDQRNKMIGGQITYTRDFENGGDLSTSLYGNYNNRKVGSTSPPDYDVLMHTEEDDSYRFGHTLKRSIPLNDSNMLTVGIDSTVNMFEKENVYKTVIRDVDAEGKQLLLSGFVQNETVCETGNHRFITTLGLRADYCRTFDGAMLDSSLNLDEEFDSESWESINPRIGLVYQYGERTTLRTGFGTSFAAPMLSSLYTVFDRGPYHFYGNPDLDPETSFTFNLGGDQTLTDKLTMRIDAHYTEGTDFISTRMISAPFNYQNDNISKVKIWGSDLEFRYELAAEWSLYAGYAFTESSVVEDEAVPGNEGNEVSFQPQHKGRLGVTYRNGGFNADLSANYIGTRYIAIENEDDDLLDDYVSLDLYLSKMVKENVKVTLGLENILDERYELYSLPSDESYAPGFLVTAGVEVQF